MSTFGSSVHKDSNGKYRVSYSYISPTDGKRKRSCKRGFSLMREATAWQKSELPKLIARLETVEAETAVNPEDVLTMGQLIEEYLDNIKVNMRASTYETKANIFKTKITPYFADMRVRDVTTNDVRKWHNEIKKMRNEKGEPYKPTYIHSMASQLSAVFNYAMAFHDLSKNPVFIAKKSMKFGKKQADERDFWTLDEYLKFSKAIQDKPMFYYAYQVLFWCGIRIGELLALTKADVDCDAMTLKVINSYSKEEHENGDVKTPSSKRTVHLPKELADELRVYLDSMYALGNDDVIFPVSRSAMHREMTRGAAAAGVKRITPHGIRHSSISLIMNYISIASVVDIASRAGHKKPDVTMIYSHRYSNKDELIARELDDMMKGSSNYVCKEQ